MSVSALMTALLDPNRGTPSDVAVYTIMQTAQKAKEAEPCKLTAHNRKHVAKEDVAAQEPWLDALASRTEEAVEK